MQEQENKIRTLCIRFNLSKETDKCVWENLHSFNKQNRKSYSYTVITALKEYFDRLSKSENDPYFETREREEKFISDIVSAVEHSIDREIPKYLSVCIGEIIRQFSNGSVSAPAAPAVTEAAENEKYDKIITDENANLPPDNSDIDLDFLCG